MTCRKQEETAGLDHRCPAELPRFGPYDRKVGGAMGDEVRHTNDTKSISSLGRGRSRHLSLDRPASRLRSRSPRAWTQPPVRAAVERYQCSFEALYRPLCASSIRRDKRPDARAVVEVVRFGGAALGRGGVITVVFGRARRRAVAVPAAAVWCRAGRLSFRRSVSVVVANRDRNPSTDVGVNQRTGKMMHRRPSPDEGTADRVSTSSGRP
ncbi:hypothetical protein EVAR_92796_1 [Eumeta japonica]|uniref:Uncharacterized protein n=1 Tax=Eumeta variegata TaxID=151549 RepID=A0A4C2A4F7_EUMVA|nr:hypothetical protein EVAR_92796_1 [Eumeta japonica]